MPTEFYPRERNSSLLTLVVIIGFIGGALGGMVSGVVATTVFLKSHPTSAVANAQTSTLTSAAQLVVEDSDVTQVVSTAESSVVSVVISKQVDALRSNGGITYDPFNDSITPDTTQTPNADGQTVEICSGTGFVISADGMILTNKHVICDDSAQYSVVFSDGSVHDATVLGSDPLTDLAILKIDATGLTPLDLGDSSILAQGESVLAIGNALGEYQNTVTKGIVSGLDRDLGGNYTGLIQTDAAINEGNSGGPLLNLAGQVIGINTAIRRDGQAEGLGFAIPINEAKADIESMKTQGRIIRAALGVRYQPITPELAQLNSFPYEYGAYISGNGADTVGVIPGSAADKAGLKDGDIILEVNGVKVDDTHPLASTIKSFGIGEVITLKIYQDGAEKDVTVTLAELPQ